LSNLEDKLVSLFNEVLLREPDSSGFSGYLFSLKNRVHTIDDIKTKLLGSFEYNEIVTPIRKQIEKVYDQLFFRKPKNSEISEHLAHFRHECRNDEKVIENIHSNSITSYLDIRPLNVEMDITNACNLRCTMCFFNDPSVYMRKRSDMSVEVFRSIASQIFPFTNRLSLSLSTEALLNKDFCKLASIALDIRVPKIYISTNATLLTEEISEKMIRMGFHAMNISLDAATKATFEKVRKGARFETVIDNIERLNHLKERHGSEYPRLSYSFVLMKSNIHELPDFIRLAGRLKASDIHLMHMARFNMNKEVEESLFDDKAKCNRMLAKSRLLADELEINLIDPGDFPLDRELGDCKQVRISARSRSAKQRFDLSLNDYDFERNCCPFPWRFVGINPYGEVVPCGWWFSEKPMGKIHTHSFEEIWKGDRYMALRKKLVSGDLHKNCMACPSAGMGHISNPASFAKLRLN